MSQTIRLFDMVALSHDILDAGLVRGQVGAVVEVFGDGAFEVEFADGEGRTYAMATLTESDFIVLRYEPISATA